ncbi:SDR family NAD(P)-dependent oxidoreductase [Salinispora arenicola]|uniref:SDR family NAD(P)-dependent oxidoreductase n=1 Tax=Salinispora arenicola TaxID=168697 RepID=UPI000380E2AF|nr:SDR family NAD(P)-dependent oxidoreductase [Salinispora arenicola]
MSTDSAASPGGRLVGQVAVVTGAARGIGRAIACRFAAEGADVILFDVARDIPGCPYPLGTSAQLATTARRCARHGITVDIYEVDIRDPDAAGDAVDQCLDRFGRIDVLVNNAGVAGPSGKPVHEIAAADWQLVIDINLTGAFTMTKLVVPGMARARRGNVINVSSTAGLVGYRHFAGYVAAKHGLVGLTRASALDYAPHGVRVNAVCPGSVVDEPDLEGRMLGEIARSLRLPPAESEEVFVRDQPGNRLVQASAVADACLWLAGASDVTGAVVPVDGGFTVR